jgi:SAM-dependent methyltransferase
MEQKRTKNWNMHHKAYTKCKWKILEMLSEHSGDEINRLLDIGCGDGAFTQMMGGMCGAKELYGIEINKKFKPPFSVYRKDANKPFWNLPIKFDIVIANQLVEHLTNPDNLFKSVHSILNEDGIFIISTPNLNSLHNRIFILMGWQVTNIAPSTEMVFGNPNRGAKSGMDEFNRHVTVFSFPAMIEMAEHYGFEVEDYCGAGFYPFNGILSDLFSNILPKHSVFMIVKLRKRK